MQKHQTLASQLGDDPHCCWFAALLSVPYTSRAWRHQHPYATGRFDYEINDRCRRLVHNMTDIAFLSNPPLQEDFRTHFLAGLDALRQADLHLYDRQEEREWLFRLIKEGPHPVMVFSYLFFAARSPQTYYTPEQIALALGGEVSVWRQKAASYELPGTIMQSGTFFVNDLGLRAVRIALSNEQKQEIRSRKIDTSLINTDEEE